MQIDQPTNVYFPERIRRLLEFSRGISASPNHSLTSWLFLRALGLIYLIAFVSLWTQILGLVGSHGILPATNYLAAAKNNLGDKAYWQLPGLFWLDSSDAFLTFLCGAGAGLALLVTFDVLTMPALAALRIMYLSFLYVGQDFMLF